MKKVGEILKEKRESLNLGLQEVAAVLKINQKMLMAIEQGETEGLLNRAFVRGFIRSYANHLKLDSKEMLQLYQFEIGAKTAATPSSEPEENKTISAESTATENPLSASVKETPVIFLEEKPKIEKTVPFQEQDHSQSYFFAGILGLIVVLSVAFAIKATMKRYRNESIVIPQANIIQNIDPVLPEAAKPVTPEEMKALETRPPDMASIISSQAQSSPTMSAAAEEKSKGGTPPAKEEKTEEKEVKTEKPVVPETKTLPVPTHAAAPAPVPAPHPPAQAPALLSPPAAVVESKPAAKPTNSPGGKEVIVESEGAVSLSYDMDGQKKTIHLKKDQVHTFKVKGPFKLQISDGQMVNVNVNGRDIGKPSTQSGPVSVTY